MPHKSLKSDIIRYLEDRNYKYLGCLGRGGFGDVIAVLCPDKREAAVKIIPTKKIWFIEDLYWPTLHHSNILQVNSVMDIKLLGVKLYFMPVVPNTLYEMITSKEFKKDPNSFNRVQKWLIQILSAMEYLHGRGFCHLDMKADNIFIDSEDNALLGDFSGLNFTKYPIHRIIAAFIYRSPECFNREDYNSISGEAYDMWAFSILALNVLTEFYYLEKTVGINRSGVHWWSHLLPILIKALTQSKFEKLVRKSFPKASLSQTDVNVALYFILFIMKLRAQDRPTARRAMNYLLIRTTSNRFMKEFYKPVKRNSREINLLRNVEDELDANGIEDTPSSKIEAIDCSTDTSQNIEIPKGRNVCRSIRNWFVSKIHRVFK